MTECISPCSGQSGSHFHFRGSALLSALFFSLSPLALQAQEAIYYSSGSGFFVNLQGQVVTNAHVLSDGCASIEVRSQGVSYPATIMAYDEKRDLAVVQASTFPGPSPLALRDERQPATENEPALALGFPGTATELQIAPSSVIEGDVPMDGDTGTEHYVTFKRSVAHGNSGGPLVDESANVLGVVRGMGEKRILRAGATNAEKLYDMDIAIAGSSLRSFLDENRISYQTRQSNTRWDADLIRVRLIGSVPNVRCVLKNKPA